MPVTPLAFDNLVEIVSVLTDAFHDYPVMQYVLGPDTPDAGKDLAECRKEAHQQAGEQLPYGNGPPLYGFSSEVSMLQWTMAIDNERAYLADDLAAACMRHRGFVLVPA